MAASHLVVLFCATAGQNGENLGSDEEQIVLFVYLLYDVANNKVRQTSLVEGGPGALTDKPLSVLHAALARLHPNTHRAPIICYHHSVLSFSARLLYIHSL